MGTKGLPRVRWSAAALPFLVSGAALSCVDLGPGKACDPTDLSTAEWRAHLRTTESYIVDPSAPILVAQMRVGDTVSVDVSTTTGSFCGILPEAKWMSTDPSVAAVAGTAALAATLTALAPGITVVFAEVTGKRADLYYLDKPVEKIRVVE